PEGALRRLRYFGQAPRPRDREKDGNDGNNGDDGNDGNNGKLLNAEGAEGPQSRRGPRETRESKAIAVLCGSAFPPRPLRQAFVLTFCFRRFALKVWPPSRTVAVLRTQKALARQ